MPDVNINITTTADTAGAKEILAALEADIVAAEELANVQITDNSAARSEGAFTQAPAAGADAGLELARQNLEYKKQFAALDAEDATAVNAISEAEMRRNSIIGQRNALTETQIELDQAVATGNTALTAELERELVVRKTALSIYQQQNLSEEASLALAERQIAAAEARLAAERAVLEALAAEAEMRAAEATAAAAAAEAQAAQWTIVGGSARKAGIEAQTITRELATGNVNARSLGALIGDLGPLIGTVGIGAYVVVEALGKWREGQQKIREEQLKIVENAGKQTDELTKQAQAAETLEDKEKTRLDILTAILKKTEEITKVRFNSGQKSALEEDVQRARDVLANLNGLSGQEKSPEVELQVTVSGIKESEDKIQDLGEKITNLHKLAKDTPYDVQLTNQLSIEKARLELLKEQASQLKQNIDLAKKESDASGERVTDSSDGTLDDDEKKRLKGEVAKSLKAAADKNRENEQAARDKAREDELEKRQAASKQNLDDELKIAQERNAGEDELAEKLEHQLKVRQEAARYAAQTGASEKEALTYAEAAVAAEEKKNAAKKAGIEIDKQAISPNADRNARSGRHFDTSGRDISDDPRDRLGNSERSFADLDEYKNRNALPLGNNLAAQPVKPTPPGPAAATADSAAPAAKEAAGAVKAASAETVAALKELATEIKAMGDAFKTALQAATSAAKTASAAAGRANQDT